MNTINVCCVASPEPRADSDSTAALYPRVAWLSMHQRSSAFIAFLLRCGVWRPLRPDGQQAPGLAGFVSWVAVSLVDRDLAFQGQPRSSRAGLRPAGSSRTHLAHR